MIQSGIFFTIPLFFSVVLELNALQTGLRLPAPFDRPCLAAAVATPRLAPAGLSRLVVRLGMLAIWPAPWCWSVGSTPEANAAIVLMPMALVGLGIGALPPNSEPSPSQAVPESQSAEVGGLQNTFTNFGASLGTALVGAVLIGSLTAGFLEGVTRTTPPFPPPPRPRQRWRSKAGCLSSRT